MGSGSWDTNLYTTSSRTRAIAGVDDFAYSADVRSKPSSEWKVNELLDPKLIKGVRESRDSVEHPESLAIAVTFDVTGSMSTIPRVLQKKLGFLMEFVVAKGGVEHPQILMSAVGDATCDYVPFQIGQFESDNRLDDQLRLIFLEGHGGGQISESYGLAFYAAARKTSCDCFEKRDRKGYWITIGDEMSWPVTREHADRIFGDQVEADLPIEQLVKEAQEKWHLFHIIPRSAHHGNDPAVKAFWQKLLGQNVLVVEDMDKICEVIAGQIGLMEGASFDDVRTAAGDEVANALVTTAPGGNMPEVQSTGTPQAPAGRPGSVDRF